MRYLITLLLFIGLSFDSNGQSCTCYGEDGLPTGETDCCPPGDDGPPVPITGIEILIGAGALLGVKRLQNLRKTNP